MAACFGSQRKNNVHIKSKTMKVRGTWNFQLVYVGNCDGQYRVLKAEKLLG